MIDQKEARESHELFRAASSLYARCSGTGEVVEMEGLCIANSRSQWFIMNAASLGRPVSSQAELAARANEARAYFAKEQHPSGLKTAFNHQIKYVKVWLCHEVLDLINNQEVHLRVVSSVE